MHARAMPEVDGKGDGDGDDEKEGCTPTTHADVLRERKVLYCAVSTACVGQSLSYCICICYPY